jgi:hypothetical protein
MLSVQARPYQKAIYGRKQKYFVIQLSFRAVQSLAISLLSKRAYDDVDPFPHNYSCNEKPAEKAAFLLDKESGS